MIPRLSGRRAPPHARAPSDADRPSLPSRAEAEHVFRQFFRLIERFEQADAPLAPETKTSPVKGRGAARRRARAERVEAARGDAKVREVSP